MSGLGDIHGTHDGRFTDGFFWPLWLVGGIVVKLFCIQDDASTHMARGVLLLG